MSFNDEEHSLALEFLSTRQLSVPCKLGRWTLHTGEAVSTPSLGEDTGTLVHIALHENCLIEIESGW